MTAEKVRAMRAKHAAGCTATQLAKENGIGLSGTCSILRGDTWKHVSQEG